MEDSNIVESAAAALAAAAAAQAAGGPDRRRRLLQALGVEAVGPLSVAVSASAFITSLKAPVWTPAVMLASVVTLFIGLWVSTVGRGGGRGNIIIAFVNLCVSFLALVVAVGLGGDFDPELLLELYGALI